MADQSLIVKANTERALTPAEFYRLAEVPPELEWFGNIRDANTCKAYANDIQEFMAFLGIRESSFA